MPRIDSAPLSFWTLLTRRLQIPGTGMVIEALRLWAASEGMPDWTHNPLATTLRMPGSRSLNSVGVQAYPTIEVGVEATARTLLAPRYREVLEALREEVGLAEIWQAINASPWCDGCQGGLYPIALYRRIRDLPVEVAEPPARNQQAPEWDWSAQIRDGATTLTQVAPSILASSRAIRRLVT